MLSQQSQAYNKATALAVGFHIVNESWQENEAIGFNAPFSGGIFSLLSADPDMSSNIKKFIFHITFLFVSILRDYSLSLVPPYAITDIFIM